MRKQVLINVEEMDIRVAILEDGTLAELFVEDTQTQSRLGNIYKGRVDSIVPGLKAVFVDLGGEKNAFLHFQDVLPEYILPQSGRPEREAPRKSRPKISDPDRAEDESLDDDYIEPLMSDEEGGDDEKATEAASSTRRKPRSHKLSVGDEILVQVIKEEIGTKGPRITTYLTLPGRFLVFMPFSEKNGGVSRRIDDANERRRLRRILSEIREEVGSVIIRTAGLEQPEEAIRHDAEMLACNWDAILKNARKVRAPAKVHDDHRILKRLVRDNFTESIDEILVDSKSAMRELIEGCKEMVPSLCSRIVFYDAAVNIFDTFEVEQQFQKALKRKVWMRSGGAIVIDETEALTAIDVNTGKYVGAEDQDSAILKTNLEACRAIARQLRLRDLGGLIIIDFIDMVAKDHEAQVMRELKRCLRQDRAKFTISEFSSFGLVEMTRKRVRKSLANSLYRPCPYCGGTSRILNDQQLWKQLKYELIAELEKEEALDRLEITVHSQFKTYLKNHAAEHLSGLSGKYGVGLKIIGCSEMHHEGIGIVRHLKSDIHKNGEADPQVIRRLGDESEKMLESTPAGHNNAL